MAKCITIHWTAGTHNVTKLDKKHYHYIVDGKGDVFNGDFAPEDNDVCSKGTYAAHTRGANTGNIGVSVAAMAGAKERPFNAGKYPITDIQLDSMIEEVADLCVRFDIPVTRQTVLTHAEWEPTHGVKQRGKWDITWLPGMDKTGRPLEVGDELRERVRAAMLPPKPEKKGLLQIIMEFISSLFGGGKK